MKKIILSFISIFFTSSLLAADGGQFTVEVLKVTSSGNESVVKCYTEYNLTSAQEIRGEGELKQQLSDIATELKFHQVDAGSLYFTHSINGEQVSQVVLNGSATITVGPFGNSYSVIVSQSDQLPSELAVCK